MDFRSKYRCECLMANTSPLHVIEANLSSLTLDFKFFRVPETEWGPINSTLKSDFSLKKIIVVIDYEDHTVSNPTHKQKLRHLPSFLKHLSTHLSLNGSITELQLVGLPLTTSDVQVIGQGIQGSKALQHVSFSRCKLGDEGLKWVVDAVQGKPSIVWLDVSWCNISPASGHSLHQLVNSQAVSRENASWKASLRGQEPLDLDLMGGLRRLSLSGNNLGDALEHMLQALVQDKWIKAIDLQHCNLSDVHLNRLISFAEKGSLVFIDVQHNDNLRPALVAKLQEILTKNAAGSSRFQFHSIETRPRSILKQRPTSAGSKPTITAKKVDNKVAKRIERTVVKPAVNHPPQNLEPKRSPNKPKPHSANSGSHVDTNFKEELEKERLARLDAERQLIKVYGELESAWKKISKLEGTVKQLKKKKRVSQPVTINEEAGIWIDSPTLENFQFCLTNLRTMLRELKEGVHFVPNTAEPEIKRGHEVENILTTLQTAVRDLVSNVNVPVEQNIPPRPSSATLTRPFTFTGATQNEDSTSTKRSTYRASPLERVEVATSPQSFHIPVEIKTPQVTAASRKLVSEPRTLTSTPLSENVTSKILPGPTASQISSSSSVRSLKGTQHDSRKESNSIQFPNGPIVLMEVPTTSSQPSQSVSGREKNLKGLKGDLEGLLAQFQTPAGTGDPSFKLSNSLMSRNDSAGTSPPSQNVNYSMEFESTSTSITSEAKSTKQLVNNNNNEEKPAPQQVKNGRNRTIDSTQESRSSSTVNLSSIVDLLGDFSVGDLGSSTLTPP